MKYTSGHENWLDFARLLFSTSVVLLHVYNLTPTAKSFDWLEIASTVGSLGVPAFFAISGFVIFMAYDNSSSLKNYTLSRFFRLYPAYILVITTTAILALLILPQTDTQDILEYIGYNSIFLNFLKPSFGELFQNNPTSAFNGALWSLKIEVIFYCTVPIISQLAKKFKISTLIILYTSGKACQIFTEEFSNLTGISEATISHQFPQQIPLFISGYACYFYYDLIKKNKSAIAIGATLALLFNIHFLQEISFTALIIITFAVLPKKRLTIPFGDISYGVYIIHFPLIQTFVLFNIHQKTGIPLFTALILATTYLLAYILSHLIERPFLKIKNNILHNKTTTQFQHQQ